MVYHTATVKDHTFYWSYVNGLEPFICTDEDTQLIIEQCQRSIDQRSTVSFADIVEDM